MPQSGYSAAGQQAIANADVLIRIFYPNGDSIVITDPEDFNHSNGTLFVRAEGSERWFHGLPFDIADRRNSQQNP